MWQSDVCVSQTASTSRAGTIGRLLVVCGEKATQFWISDWMLISIIRLITCFSLTVFLYSGAIVLECVHRASLISGALGLVRQWTDGLALPGSVGQDGCGTERQNWEREEKCRTQVIADKWTLNRPSTSFIIIIRWSVFVVNFILDRLIIDRGYRCTAPK